MRVCYACACVCVSRLSFQINNTNAAQEPHTINISGSLTDELATSNDAAQPLLESVQLASDSSAGDNNKPMYIMNTVWTKSEIVSCACMYICVFSDISLHHTVAITVTNVLS